MAKRKKKKKRKSNNKSQQKEQQLKQPQPNQQKIPANKPLVIPQWLLTVLKWLWGVIKRFWALLGIILLIVSFYTLYPRVDVETGQSLDYYDPFYTPFIITNNGYFPIYDITYQIIVSGAKTTNGIIVKDFVGKLISRSGKPFFASEIEPNKGVSAFINKLNPVSGISGENKFKFVEAYIKISYNVFPNFIRFNEWYRFNTHRTKQGEYLWFEQEIIDTVVDRLEKNFKNYKY